jgi:hypothetical protein
MIEEGVGGKKGEEVLLEEGLEVYDLRSWGGNY